MTLDDATEQAYKNGYEKGYSDGKNSISNWISVKDKLPDIEQMCLLYMPCDGFVCVGFMLVMIIGRKETNGKSLLQCGQHRC